MHKVVFYMHDGYSGWEDPIDEPCELRDEEHRLFIWGYYWVWDMSRPKDECKRWFDFELMSYNDLTQSWEIPLNESLTDEENRDIQEYAGHCFEAWCEGQAQGDS